MGEGKGNQVGHDHGNSGGNGPHGSSNWELDMARKTSASCWDFMG